MSASATIHPTLSLVHGDAGDTSHNGEDITAVTDRRESAWADPKTWVSIMAVLLTIALFLAGLIVAQLSALSGKIEGLIVVTTKQGADYEAMKEQIHTMKEEIGALREH